MKPATPTGDESQRLSSLQNLNILDTPPEERFDRITRLVRATFEVPIALVSLVDENRQWFKSCFGLNVRQTARDISFCGHAIQSSDIFVIEDTLNDPDFQDNPLVTGNPFIRFYAGAPLSSPDGRRIGTLCLIDRQKRSLSDEDKERLRQMANMVEHELISVQSTTMDSEAGVSNKRGLLELADYCLWTSRQYEVPLTLALLTARPQSSRRVQEAREAVICIAEEFKYRLRETDVLARIADDQFAILLPNCEPDEANIILGAYLDAIHDQLERLSLADYIDVRFSTESLDPFSPSAMKRLESL